MLPTESILNTVHQSANVHNPKNFTAAAQLVEKSSTNLPHSDTQTQAPNFSAFDSRNSSRSADNSNTSATRTNQTTARINDSSSDTLSQDPAQLPFGSQNSMNPNPNMRTSSPSGNENAAEGTRASHTAESLIGSIMSPKTLLSTAMSEISNSTVRGDSNKTKSSKIMIPHSSTILLSNQIIPSKDYLYLYDSIVGGNVTGNLVARLPCSSNMKSDLLILAGYLPKLKSINDEARPIGQMSKPGLQCIYDIQISQYKLLPRGSNQNNNNILDLALYNPTNNAVSLPPGSSITINLFDSFAHS